MIANKPDFKNGSVSALALIAAGILTTPAYAQSGEQSDTAESGDNVIIVTAQRRGQQLEDVPIAITAYDQKTLDTLAVKKTIDLVDTIPNMVGSNNTSLGSANVYFLRGQGQDESFPTFDPAVGTYVDEIFYARQNGNNISFFDVERLEVLRGPQGTLFGKNTTGGAINVVLRRPGDELGGFVEASFGKFDEIVARGSLDLPLSDKAKFMVSGFFTDDNGWLANPGLGRNLNDRHAWGGRLAADIELGDSARWFMAVDYIEDDGTNIAGRDTNLDTGANPPSGNYGDVELVSTSILPNGLGAVFPGAVSKANYGSETVSFNFVSNISVDTGDVGTLSFISGYRRVDNDFLVNFPLPQFDGFMAFPSAANPSPDDIFIIDNIGTFRQNSHELKWNGDLFDDRLNLTAGLYYLKESNLTDFAAYFAFFVPSRDRVIRNTTRNLAGYLQGDISITDTLTATLGVRYTDEKKVFRISDNRPAGNITDLTTANMLAQGIPIEQREKVWTPRFALTLEPNPDTMIYASATRGFRSGGWNARVNNSNGLQPFQSEFVWNYELGTRLNLGDSFDLFVTGYHLVVDNLQINTSLGAGVFGIGNAGKMENTGLEVETFIRPTEGLSFYAALGLQDAKYKLSAAEIAACTVPNGNLGAFDANCNIAEVKRTPSYQVTFGGSYRIDLGSVSVTPRGSIRMSDDQISTSRNRGPADGYTLVNAGIDFGLMDDNLNLAVECSNCFNKRYLVATFGNQDTYFNRPGRWTLRATYKFGGRAN